MPLTQIQSEIARLLAANRSPDSYLAGGAALHMAPRTKRYSDDLDYFQDSDERVASAFADDRKTLDDAGLDVRVLLSQPGYVSAIASRGDDATKIEWAHDSAWRYLPTVEHQSVGYTLHPIDLALNKLLALVGRDEPRDFLDTIEVCTTTLPLGALCWAAAGKDPGYTPELLLSMLRRRGKYRPEDFERLMLTTPVDLVALKSQWLSFLDEAEAFISSRNPSDMGCLFYSKSRSDFVGAFDPDDPDIAPHYGRPGGVVPTFA